MTTRKLNLNTASSVHLTAIKGIGPSRAEAIVRYRDKNGAFTSVDELSQVPHVGDMPTEELERVKQQLTIATPDSQTSPQEQNTGKLNVNRANAAELRQVPGIGEAHAEAIVRYRQERGPIRDLSELDEIPHFRDQSTLERQHIKSALEV